MKTKISKLLLAAALAVTVLAGASAKVNATTTGSPLQNGAWLGENPTANNINTFQQNQGKKMDYVNMFINFQQTLYPTQDYPTKGCTTTGFKDEADAVYNNGSQLILTWEPQGITDDDINNGKYDDYIYLMAAQIKGYNKPIIIRLMHEVNSSWYSWATGYQNGVTNNYNSYISAYRRIVNAFRSSGVTNVKFMYNVNNFNVGNNTSYTDAYPGNDYVDIVSIDGYNWGTKPQSWGVPSWQSFDQVFSSAYNAIKGLNKPIFIAEISSAEQGGSKAAWITDAFNKIDLGSYPLIDAVIWFNENKENDWRIESSSSALEAYKAAISSQTTDPVLIRAENYSSASGVQKEACSESGQDVGYIDDGDWMAFNSVNLPVSGEYKVEYRVASPNGGGVISLEQAGGAKVYGTVNVPATGGWQNWQTISHIVKLDAGTQAIGIGVPKGGYNISWIKFVPIITLRAENYSSASGVQKEPCSESGQDVGYIDDGDWMAFNSVNLPVSGEYKVEYRVASPNGGGVISLEQAGGAKVYGTVNVPATGGWQSWQTISNEVTLDAGTQAIGIGVPKGGFNISWIKFTPISD